MSSGLVKVLALGAGALITAGAVERGWRHGREKGNDALGEFDANAIMRSTYSTSDDFIIDGISGAARNGAILNTGPIASITRGFHGIKNVFGELFKSAVPLGIAGASFLIGGPIGWAGLAGLGIWGLLKAKTASGLFGSQNTERLDIMG